MYCRVCGTPIPPGRLEAVPHTTTCVQHSEVREYRGDMEYGGTKGTAAHLVLVSEEQLQKRKSATRRAGKQNHRIYNLGGQR